MLFNLSIKNIKKSLKDYSIYFFTLVAAVAVFYSFNSLDSQTALMEMNKSRYEIVKALINLLGYVSIFISIILGFLITYSNNFLIKRRKKEFGLYLTLGMSKSKVSAILVIETLLVGLISLVVGLFVGIFLSQLLSVFTAKLFEVNMATYKFVFSSAALYKTLIYFGIIFLLVMIFNVISLSKNKVINLLTAGKKNEKIKIRNTFVILLSFILAIAFLGYAYHLLFKGAMFAFNKDIILMLITGALGTYFLFFSISGFFLRIISKIKKVYYKNLNMFVLKQIDSKANRTVISTTVICLMLLLTIGILSGAISLVSVFNSDTNNNNMTDITYIKSAYDYVHNENGTYSTVKNSKNIADMVNQEWFKDYIKDYAIYSLYQYDGLTMDKFISQKNKQELIKQYGNQLTFDSSIDIMSESDYNDILRLYGLKEVNLKDDEYILTANITKAINFYSDLYEEGNNIKINENNLHPATKNIVKISFKNYSGASNMGTIIVDDKNVANLENHFNTLLANYIKTDDKEKIEKEFLEKCDLYGGSREYFSKLEMENSNIGMKGILTFVGLYLGIIFAISSATVLAIGQLSESSDNKQRYLVLKQIGADESMIKNSLFTQIAIAFITPLLVALFHSFFGLRELNGMISLMGDLDITKSIFLTSIFIIIVYGGYFIATYLASKNIIKND